MKVGVLVMFIVLPMLASIGLYCYSFISTRWSYIDENLLEKYTSYKGRQRLQTNNLQLQIQKTRHAFRSRYGLFGYCLDYRWIPLFTPKSSSNNDDDSKSNTPFYCKRCNQPVLQCQELNTDCCMTRCDTIPDCPSYIDEKECTRPYNQTRYYWPEGNCMWQSTWIGNQALPRYLSSTKSSAKEFHYHVKRIRYYIMFLLFIAAPLLTFLYEWVQDRLHRADYTYEFNQTEALLLAFNPWLIQIERLGLAFWLTVAAVGTTLFTTILSCCFCCGLQSDKSKIRFHVDNDVYEIVQMTPYDD